MFLNRNISGLDHSRSSFSANIKKQKISTACFIFAYIFGILNNSRFDRAVSKHFHNPQPKEVRHEDFPVRHPFFQLPADECEKNTLRNYEFILGNFQAHFGDIDLSTVTSEDILAFMSTITDGTKQNTKKLRFTLLSAFFNFVKNSHDPDIQNPCDNPSLRKLFRAGKLTQFKILEKDVVDEIIFRTRNPRNRLMLELMARSGMRVGEVLKLTPMDIEDRKAIIRDPKSGREAEATENFRQAQKIHPGKEVQS